MSSQQLMDTLISATTSAKEDVKRYELSATDRRKEAEGKRNEAKTLLAEADRLEEQARDDDESAEQARDVIKSLNFNTVVARLKKNDADLQFVDTDEENLAFPDGHGKALGRALSNNTVVTHLTLDFATFLSAHTLHAAYKNIRDINRLKAELSKEIHPEGLLRFLKESTSLQSFTIDYNHESLNTAIALKMAELLLAALAERTSLRKVLWYAHLPPTAFCNFLQANNSIECLGIAFRPDTTPYSANERRSVASAVAKSAALEHLWLIVSTQEEDTAIQILQALHKVKTLHDLSLTAYDETFCEEYYSALSRYLKSVAVTLRRFRMEGFYFNDATMMQVLSGVLPASVTIGDNDNSVSGSNASCIQPPSSTLSRLLFLECRWDNDAAERLAIFLQTRTTNESGGFLYQSSLRMLHIGCVGDLGQALSRRVAASILMKQGVEDTNGRVRGLFPTIGSQLEVLHLDHVSSAFFRHLSDHADRMGSLQELHLTGISKDASVAFAKCLPKLTMLLVLDLKDMAPGAADFILKGLRRNGSVVNVLAENGTAGTGNGFDAIQWRKVNAYCRRNKTLPTLIQSMTTGASDDDDDGGGSSSIYGDSTAPTVATRKRNASAMDHDSDSASSSTTLSSLSPALLQVTHQVPITQSSMVLRGLLSQSQSRREPTAAATATACIRHDGFAKRSRREPHDA